MVLKDLFHPSCIVTVEWLVILILYAYTKHGLFSISDYTLCLVLMWSIIFSISCFMFSRIKFQCSIKISNQSVNHSLIKSLYIPLVLLKILFIISIFSFFGFSPGQIRKGLLEDLPVLLKLLFYIDSFSTIYYFALFFDKKSSIRMKIFFTILVIFCSFLKMNKTVFLSIFFSFCYLLYSQKKLNVKSLLFLLLIVCGSVFLLVYIRKDSSTIQDFTIGKYLAIYTLSPLTAFGQIVNGDIKISAHESYVFIFLNRVFSKLFNLNLNTTIFGPWINVPFPTNVYTILAPFYIDFKTVGIVTFSFIEGAFSGYIYSYVKRNFIAFKIFYAGFIFSLFLQFFSDYFFYAMSTLLQYLIFSFVFVVKIKEKKYFKANSCQK